MTYTPPQNRRPAAAVSILLMVIGLTLFYISQAGFYRLIFQTAALCTLTASIFILTRYALCFYRYTITDDGDLVVEKVQGGKAKTVCSLDMTTGRALVKKSAWKAEKARFGRITRLFNFRTNLFAREMDYYIFEFNGETDLLKMECDDAFRREILRRITVTDPAAADE